MKKLKRIQVGKELSFYSLDDKVLDIPFYQSNVPAGFPSPAEDFMDLDLNLQEYLVQVSLVTTWCWSSYWIAKSI